MILVTGASGFLGLHLLQALQRQQVPVRALYHSQPPSNSDSLSNITWQQCDLLDVMEVEKAMKNIRIVFHCAAIVSFDPRKKNKMIEQNVAITANVVNAALNEQVDRFLHVSSIAALGRSYPEKENGSKLLINEENPWVSGQGNSAYAESKYLSELEVWRGIAEGLSGVIINPSVILGEGNWDKGSAHLMKIVDQEFPWYTDGINGWVDVQDVVNVLLLLQQSAITESRFIISAGNYPYKEIFRLMAEAIDKKPPHRKANKWMTELVWRMELLKSRLSGKEAVISKETARTAQTKCYYENDKILKAFPHFQFTPIEDTIARMGAAYVQSKHTSELK